MQVTEIIIAILFVAVAVMLFSVDGLLDYYYQCVLYEDPLLQAIGTLKRGGYVPHEDAPAENSQDGEVLASVDGKEIGLVEKAGDVTQVLAGDLSCFPEGRVWYRTGIQIDDLTWSVLWGTAGRGAKIEKDRNRKKQGGSREDSHVKENH